jgi:tRNA(Ile)-lysidine synthase
MNIAEKISEEITVFLKTNNLINNPIILGLSGGPDSVFLFHILAKLHKNKLLNLICLHINHGWREEAKDEESFCRELSKQNSIEIIIRHASEFDLKNNGSIEELGRNIRQQSFSEAIRILDSKIVFLAHHNDDLVETFFIKSIRGTSIQGLGGIREFAEPFYRPLLHISKQELLNYLKENNLKYCLDQSNDSMLFLRNRIRHQLIPMIQKIDPRASAKISSNMFILQKESDLLNLLVLEKFETLVLEKEPLSLDMDTLLLQPEILQKKIILILFRRANVLINESQAVLSEVLRFLKNKKSKKHIINDCIILKNKNSLSLKKIEI